MENNCHFQRRKQVQTMMEKYEEECQQQDQWTNPEIEGNSSDEEESREFYEGQTSKAVLSNEITTTCGSAIVEISTPGLSSEHYLGVNTVSKLSILE